MPNKDKKNKTSFTSESQEGNKNAEKWTFEEAENFFQKAIDLSKTQITLTDIANTLDVYPDLFEYLTEKFPVFRTVKNRIMQQIENNTYKGALNGDYVPSVAIFGLKNNHGWKDKTEIETNQNITNKIDPSALSTEELIKRAKAIKEIELNE